MAATMATPAAIDLSFIKVKGEPPGRRMNCKWSPAAACDIVPGSAAQGYCRWPIMARSNIGDGSGHWHHRTPSQHAISIASVMEPYDRQSSGGHL